MECSRDPERMKALNVWPWVLHLLRWAGCLWIGEWVLTKDGIETVAVIAFAIAVMALFKAYDDEAPKGKHNLQAGLDKTD